MFKIIIHVFQIENICINEYYLMFKILIHAFQKVLYLHFLNENIILSLRSLIHAISKGLYLHLMKYYFNV